MSKSTEPRIVVEQIGSRRGTTVSQRATLTGMALNRIGRKSSLPDNPSVRGMIAKVAHLVRVVEKKLP